MAVPALERLHQHFAQKEAERKTQADKLAAEMRALNPNVPQEGAMNLARTSLDVPRAEGQATFFRILHETAVRLTTAEGYPDADPEEIYRILLELPSRPPKTEEQKQSHKELPLERKNKQREELKFEGSSVTLGKKSEFPMAQYLFQHLGQPVSPVELTEQVYGSVASGHRLTKDIWSIRQALKRTDVPLEIISIKKGRETFYMMISKGQKPEGVKAETESAPKEQTYSFDEALKLLSGEQSGWSKQQLITLLHRSKVLNNSEYIRRAGGRRDRKLTPEGIELLKLAKSKMAEGDFLKPKLLDRMFRQAEEPAKPGQMISLTKESALKTFNFNEAAKKLRMKPSTVQFMTGIKELFLEGEHYVVTPKGSRKWVTLTEKGLERIKFIDSRITKGKRMEKKTVVKRFTEWFGHRSEKHAKSHPKGELAWGLVKPLTVQEEAKLAQKMLDIPKGILERYQIQFSPEALGEARTVWKKFQQLRVEYAGREAELREVLKEPVMNPDQLCQILEKKFGSLAQNPVMAEKNKFGNPNNSLFYNPLAREMLLAFQKLPGKETRKQFIHDFICQDQTYNGTSSLEITGKA